MILHAKILLDQPPVSKALYMLENSTAQQRKAISSKQMSKTEGTVMSFLSDTLLTVTISGTTSLI